MQGLGTVIPFCTSKAFLTFPFLMGNLPEEQWISLLGGKSSIAISPRLLSCCHAARAPQVGLGQSLCWKSWQFAKSPSPDLKLFWRSAVFTKTSNFIFFSLCLIQYYIEGQMMPTMSTDIALVDFLLPLWIPSISMLALWLCADICSAAPCGTGTVSWSSHLSSLCN